MTILAPGDQRLDVQPCPCCFKAAPVYAVTLNHQVFWRGCLGCAQGIFDLVKFLQTALEKAKNRDQEK